MRETESKPYPVDLRHGDCLEIMKKLPDKSVDLILCDLPYGNTKAKEDVPLPFVPLWEQYERIIKDRGAILLFAQGLFYVDLVNSNRRLFRYDIVWDKKLVTGFLNSRKMPLRSHEQIAVFYKKLPTYNPQFTIGEGLHGRGTAYKNKSVVNNNYGKYAAEGDTRKGCKQKYPKSIISFQKPHPAKANHRTEKPVALLEWLIRTFTHEGDTVLDNCMGSGSTGVACKNTNRCFIGIELDEKYFNFCKERLEQEGR